MNKQTLQQILFQLQEQNKELLTAVMNLQVSNNQLKKQLNHDFNKVYEELYSKKEIDEVKEFLASKKFITEELNHITDKETSKIVEKFEENFQAMEENLEYIFNA